MPKEGRMTVKQYIKNKRRTITNGVVTEIVSIPDAMHPTVRMLCHLAEGVAGERMPYGGSDPKPGFYPYLSEKDLATFEKVLADESHAHGVRFTLDDELNAEDFNGLKIRCFYKMTELTSTLV
jgi:hypothetical protein